MIDNKIQKLCECGCGKPAPLAKRNWNYKGIKKGQPLRFICGHHNRGKKESKESKIKRLKTWGADFEISPYIEDRVIRFYPKQKRWYCCDGKSGCKIPHARAVYKHYFGEIPDGFIVHHKNGTAEKIEDDCPENLILVSKIWNLHYFPWLAKGFNVHESEVTKIYLEIVHQYPQEKVFKEVCRRLLEI